MPMTPNNSHTHLPCTPSCMPSPCSMPTQHPTAPTPTSLAHPAAYPAHAACPHNTRQRPHLPALHTQLHAQPMQHAHTTPDSAHTYQPCTPSCMPSPCSKLTLPLPSPKPPACWTLLYRCCCCCLVWSHTRAGLSSSWVAASTLQSRDSVRGGRSTIWASRGRRTLGSRCRHCSTKLESSLGVGVRFK